LLIFFAIRAGEIAGMTGGLIPQPKILVLSQVLMTPQPQQTLYLISIHFLSMPSHGQGNFSIELNNSIFCALKISFDVG